MEDRKTWREDDRGETYEASVSDEEVSFFHSSTNLELWERGAIPLERYFEAAADGADRTVRELIAEMGLTRDEVDEEVRRRLEDPDRDRRLGREDPVPAEPTAVVSACPRPPRAAPALAAGTSAPPAREAFEVRFRSIAKGAIGGSVLCVSGLMLVDPAPTPGWEALVKVVALLALMLTPTLIHEW